MVGNGERAYIDGSWQRDSRMRNRCAFGCGGSGDLEYMELAQPLASHKRASQLMACLGRGER